MKKYSKIIDGRTVIKPRNQIVVVIDGKQIINPNEATLLADGWKVYEPVILTAEDVVPEDDRALGELAEGDYKVIKCMEAFLCGEPLPYDIAALHAERQALREIINHSLYTPPMVEIEDNEKEE